MAETIDIIQQSMRQQGYKDNDIQKALGGIATLVKRPGAKLVNFGNTVFLVMVKAPGEVEVHTFSAETPQQLARNFVSLSKYLKNIGVKTAKTYSDDVRFKEIGKMTGLPIKVNQTAKMFGNEMKPSYEYVLEM